MEITKLLIRMAHGDIGRKETYRRLTKLNPKHQQAIRQRFTLEKVFTLTNHHFMVGFTFWYQRLRVPTYW